MRWVARILLCLTIGVAHGEHLGRGWWHGRFVTYRVRNGFAIYQGDIVLGRAGEIPSEPPSLKGAEDRPGAAFLTGPNNAYLWPNAVVPYTVDPAISGRVLANLNQAIAFYQSNTPVRWVARTNEANYVFFTTQPADSTSCGLSDSIGVLGGKQSISVINDPTCGAGTFTHEMGHAIGMEHEQTRYDRDFYVKVRFENIDKNQVVEFEPDSGQIDVLPYEQGSIMHYDPASFQRNSLNTIDTIPLGIPISHRQNLSAGDIEAIRTMYGSPSSTTTIYTNPPRLSLIVDGQTVQTPQTYTWAAGSRHTVDAPPGPQASGTQIRYNFARWSNDGPRSQTVVAGPQVRVVGANFETQYKVLVNVKGSGGTVSANPASPDGFYTWGTVVTATATPAAGFKFLQWDNPSGLSTFHGLSSNPAAFTVNSTGYAYTADFTNAPVTSITTGIPGVTVNVDNSTVALPVNLAWAPASTHAVAVPTPSQNNGSTGSPFLYAFQNWSDGGAASHTVTATSAGSTIVSNWQLKYLVSTYTADPLDIYTSTNGHVSVSPPSSECGNPAPTDCYYPAGTRLTWTPSGVGPFVFTGWSGDLTGTTTPGSLTVNDQVYVTGNFAQPGRLVRSAVVDAANYQGQGVSPGEIIAVFGLQFGPPAQLTGLQVAGSAVTNNLAQTRVLFDGQPAPLVYVSANQISAIVPYAVAGKTSTRMAIEYQGRAGNAVNLPVLASHPALFTLDSSGSGQVAALNQNNSVNGANNPAVRGSVIQLFGTGEGATTPAGSDGKIIADIDHKPLLPVKVTIAGRDAQVMYFGEAPGLVSGVFQANAVVPADCPQGLAPVSVTVGTAASPAFARVAVQ